MVKYVIKRILLMLLTLFIILTFCLVLIKLLPLPTPMGNPNQVATILERRKALGYDKPIIVQVGIFWRNVLLHWDWGIGENIYPTQDVWAVIGSQLPATMAVNLYSLIFSIPIGLGLGIWAAIRKNKVDDHIISILVMIFISVPSFIYAFLVQYLLCFKAQWFPMTVYPGTNWLEPRMFYSMLPAIMSLAFGTIAGLTRYTRAELSEVLTNDFMLLARTKGLTRGQATRRHALRNAMVVIMPMILGEFISIISGSLIIEGMFSIPGIGKLYLTAISARDYNFFMALSAFFSAIGLLAGLVIDLSYGFIDPRIRMGAGKTNA